MTPKRVALLGALIAIMTGGRAPAQAPAPEPARPAAPAPAVVGVSVPEPAPAYERKGRRDPFEPVDGLQPEMASPTVASARLRGIVRGRTARALVETSDGLGYILRVGDTLAEGRLVEIGADSVVFTVPARRGSAVHRIVLRLPED
jgi:hypothetical protein